MSKPSDAILERALKDYESAVAVWNKNTQSDAIRNDVDALHDRLKRVLYRTLTLAQKKSLEHTWENDL